MKKPVQAKLGGFINQLLSLAVMLRSRCLASQPLSEKQRDPEQKHLRMTRGVVGGFTLIELLVVVLIIGILSAIALPQYQKAVRKSRAAAILPVLRSVYDAERVFRLEGGDAEGEGDLSKLSIAVPKVSLPGYGNPSATHFHSCTGENEMHWCDGQKGFSYVLQFSKSGSEAWLWFGVEASAKGQPVFFCKVWGDDQTETCADYGFKNAYSLTQDCSACMPGSDVYSM